MAVRHFKKGTGITARDWVTADGKDAVVFLFAQLDAWTADWKAGGESNYGAVSFRAANSMRAIRDESDSAPHADDSEADFARRFINADEHVKALLDRIASAEPDGRQSPAFRDADNAARFAWRAALTFTMAAMKFEHEDDAVRGQKLAERLRAKRDEGNRRRKNEAREKWDRVQAEASKYFNRNPDHSKRAAAGYLKRSLDLKDEIETIADAIDKRVTTAH